ncbi:MULTISPECIES: TonB family protein [unclassified Comamonas]|jgi:TonB family protein|uniref:Energy transducer TonB n=1 Tax=Comamonas squillarum TaxID=2977320 RepID=A0ABY5ZVB2_9BURK|nr:MULTISPECIES: TonB family protein [unclassified Comamonas]PWB17191.1 TonB family protein [Comamonas sp. JNW]UXC17902.1 energy transducer TonB [Comamonas sp. PR12]
MPLIRTSSAVVTVLAALLAGCATNAPAPTPDAGAAATTAPAANAAPAAAGCAGNACDSAPQLLTGASPRFPYPAGAQPQPASVRVQFVVNTDGAVSDVKTLTTTSRDMATEVERAVRQWKYRPAMKNNQPMKVILQQQFDFKP